MWQLDEKKVAGMSREERINTAKSILRGLTARQRTTVCNAIPELCDFLEGKTSSCSTSYGVQSKELVELTERLQVLAEELRRYGAAMQRKRREELKLALAQLDLMEMAQRAEAEEVA